MTEPSNAEQATWSYVTREYVCDLQIENERLRQAITDHIEGHDWLWVDPVSRGYPDVDDLRAALQPKENTK